MSQEEAPFIYIAGPLFDPGERWYLEQIDAICHDLGLRTYLPHRDGGIKAGAATDFASIFAADLAALERADLVVAVWNGPDVDSGTAWEIGFAYARGMPVVGLHEDIRIQDAKGQVNIVVSQSAQDICGSFDELRSALERYLGAQRKCCELNARNS
jgi:nucleoside 2-deoxyribosyltransferase